MSQLLGQKWGNYQLVQLLGQGSFAQVYLGKHVHLGMHAAIKILHTHITGTALHLFHQEAQTIADLQHPNIIRILDFDVNEGRPFLVMDYAPQGSLRLRHPHGTQLPLPLVIPYIQQAANALQYAHNRKLIHRDVKPENMLLSNHDELLLTDFGIATIAHSTSSMNIQSATGTVAFMAPEQIQGKPRPASDQYALAITAYLWLSGILPFQGSTTELLAQHIAATPPPLREHVPDLPEEIANIIARAMHKAPQERFEDVQEFASMLTQAANLTPIAKYIDTPPHTIQAFNQSNKHEIPASPQTGENSTIVVSEQDNNQYKTEIATGTESSQQPQNISGVVISATEEAYTSSPSKPLQRHSRRFIIAGAMGAAALAALGTVGIIWAQWMMQRQWPTFFEGQPPHPAVRAIIWMLKQQGFLNTVTNPTGTFDAEVRGATEAFQVQEGLPKTGQVDGATWEMLIIPSGYSGRGHHIRALQEILNEFGADLDIDGDFGPLTKQALETFQQERGLTVTGVADLDCWYHLITLIHENNT